MTRWNVSQIIRHGYVSRIGGVRASYFISLHVRRATSRLSIIELDNIALLLMAGFAFDDEHETPSVIGQPPMVGV